MSCASFLPKKKKKKRRLGSWKRGLVVKRIPLFYSFFFGKKRKRKRRGEGKRGEPRPLARAAARRGSGRSRLLFSPDFSLLFSLKKGKRGRKGGRREE